jgi:hypothetical protein
MRNSALAQPPANTPEARCALTLKMTAQVLSISEISVRRLVKRGLLRPNRALKKLLFSSVEIQRFLRDY